MKVVLASFLFDQQGGGAASVVKMLADFLVENGHEVTILTTHSNRSINSKGRNPKVISFFPRNLYWVAEKKNQPVIKKILWQIADVWNPYVYRIVRNIITDENPDVVHVHKLRGLSPSIWRAVKDASPTCPVLHTCHDYELISPEGTLTGRIGRKAAQRHFLMRPYQLIRANAGHHVDFVTSPSNFTLEKHIHSGFFLKSGSQVVNNSHGLTNEKLDQIRNQIENTQGMMDKPLNLLYLGRFEKNKGVDILCDAFVKALEKKTNSVLKMAGWGSLENMLKMKYKNVHQIEFLGMINGKQKEKYLSECHALVVPSCWLEVFGIVIVEAFAYGKPVLASSIGAIPEIITQDKTGYLFKTGNHEELVKLIIWMANNLNKLNEMKEACFSEARKYTSERINEQYLSLYKQLKKSNS